MPMFLMVRVPTSDSATYSITKVDGKITETDTTIGTITVSLATK